MTSMVMLMLTSRRLSGVLLSRLSKFEAGGILFDALVRPLHEVMASGNLGRYDYSARIIPPGFRVVSGSGAVLIPFFLLGFPTFHMSADLCGRS
jgi:hypothetical protein